MRDDYEAFARTYHLEYGQIGDDVPFYLELAKSQGGATLELAVGTGRVAIALARKGVPVFGIDLSPTMLAVLADRAGREPDLPLAFMQGGDRGQA